MAINAEKTSTPEPKSEYSKALEATLKAVTKAATTGQGQSVLHYAQAYQALKDANRMR